MGFDGKQVQVKGFITLKTAFRAEESVRVIKVRYLIIYDYSSYNLIIMWIAFNLLGVTLSTLYLHMKYIFPNGRIMIIQGDQETSRGCY